MFEIDFTPTSARHVRNYRKFEQKVILDAIEQQLLYEPNVATRNRKPLDENNLANWELRVDRYRVFYDIIIEDDRQIVKIKAIGHKQHNILYIDKQEVQL